MYDCDVFQTLCLAQERLDLQNELQGLSALRYRAEHTEPEYDNRGRRIDPPPFPEKRTGPLSTATGAANREEAMRGAVKQREKVQFQGTHTIRSNLRSFTVGYLEGEAIERKE